MPEVYEVEVVTGEAASVVLVPASSLEVEVHIESVATVGRSPCWRSLKSPCRDRLESLMEHMLSTKVTRRGSWSSKQPNQCRPARQQEP